MAGIVPSRTYISMDLETLEQVRATTTMQVMQDLAKMVADTNVAAADRLTAAKVLDGMSDSIIKVHLLNRLSDTTENSTNKLTGQLDRLLDDRTEKY